MQIFLDTANTEEIQKGFEFGIVDGITTNSSPVARKKRNFLPQVNKPYLKDWVKVNT